MAGTIKGIIVEIGGDTSKLQKALSKVNTATSSLSKELRGINSLLKLDPSNTELLSQKQEVLSQTIENTKEKLKQLKKVQDEVIANPDNVSEENYRNLQREIVNTENKLKSLQSQASNWTKAGKALEEYGDKITKISKKLDNVGSTLTTSLTLPVLAIGTAAVTTGNDFEAQMSRVQAIAGATKDELEELTNQAIELGAKTSFSASEVAEGMENLASAGFTTNEIMEAMPGLLDLAASSGADLATSSEIAASAIRGFGLEANTSAHVADVFAEAAARTNAQTEDMGEAMKYVAPVAKTVGLSIEETAAAIGIMSDAGVKGSQAGTTLRGGLTRIVKPTKMVRDAMAELGVEFYDSNGKMKSLTEIIKTLQEHTKGLTDETKNQALAQIFGTEALSGMLALVNRGSDELANMTKSFEECDGAASEMADTMLDNTSGSLESLSGSLESAGIAIQRELAPYIKDLAEWIQDLVDQFTNLSDEEKKNILKTAALVAAIGPAIKIISKLGTGVGTVTKGIGTLTQAIGVAAGKITTTSTSTQALASVIKILGSSMGGTIGVIGLGTAAMYAYHENQAKVTREANALRKEIENEAQSFAELKANQEAQLSTDFAQINTTQTLWNELKNITDENGKIKAGYEERAKVITSTLSEALGTEIEVNGNVIEKYKDLQNEIDKTIQKKKAEAIISAEQGAYNEAIQKRADAEKQLMSLEDQIEQNRAEYAMADYGRRTQLDMDLQALTKTYQEQKGLVDGYNNTIADYEYDFALMTQNTGDSLQELMQRNAVTLQTDTSNLQTETLNQMGILTNRLTTYKDLKQQEIQAGNEANSQMYQKQMEADQQQLQLVTQSLASQITSVEDLTPEMVKAYGDIAGYSTEEFNKAISQLPEDVQTELSNLVWTVDSNTTLPDANASLGDRAAQKFKEKYSSSDGKSASEDYIAGAQQGIENKKSSFWNILFNLGKRGNSNFRSGLGDGSPSVLAKKAIIDYFAGAEIGADKSGKDFVKSLNNYGKLANDEFTNALSYENINKQLKQGFKIPKNINGLQSALTAQVKESSNVNYNVNNIFNVQELDKERLEQCFNYIDRKYSTKFG